MAKQGHDQFLSQILLHQRYSYIHSDTNSNTFAEKHGSPQESSPLGEFTSPCYSENSYPIIASRRRPQFLKSCTQSHIFSVFVFLSEGMHSIQSWGLIHTEWLIGLWVLNGSLVHKFIYSSFRKKVFIIPLCFVNTICKMPNWVHKLYYFLNIVRTVKFLRGQLLM